MELNDYFAAHPRGALAFSGGTDSAFLLWAALEAGADVSPYFIQTPFQPLSIKTEHQILNRSMV